MSETTYPRGTHRSVPVRRAAESFINLFTRRLRDQIVIPYLVLATVLALSGTYLLLNAASRSLYDRFNAQLVDAAQGGADSFVKAQMDQLAGLRAIIYTQGFAEALDKRDTSTLSSLIAPQALNYSFDRVTVVAQDGSLLLSLPPITSGTSPLTQDQDLASLVDSTLHSTGAQDKMSSITGSASHRIFYTAAPAHLGDRVIGAVLVGTDLSRLMRLVARNSLSDGVGLYGPGGTPLGAAIVASSTVSLDTPVLPDTWFDNILSDKSGRLKFRTIFLNGENYVEALAPVPGRGLGDKPPGVYGVMLRSATLDSRLQQTALALVPVFALGLLLIVLMGRALAAWIDRPVLQLVAASNDVAQGNLEVRVAARRHDELGVLASRFNEMVDGLRQLIFVKDLFGRFVSPEVSERLLSGEIELGGEQRVVTTLFSDLRNFTHLSEEHPPAAIVDLLNEYFRAIVTAARNHGGIVNKFGGDSTLIVFGAPLESADHADRALATALEMRASLARINAHRVKEGWEPLFQGIGINTGLAVAGQIGSEDRMEYTVIGDSVNTSSRLEALTKTLTGCDIIFSDATRSALTNPVGWVYDDLGEVEIRGKQSGIRVFGLLRASRRAANTIKLDSSVREEVDEHTLVPAR